MNALLNIVSDGALVKAVSKSVPLEHRIELAALREGAAVAAHKVSFRIVTQWQWERTT